jgi:predicted unusual protein kinase regulating ubiquinone biosynthesis (AarF/ABC1/UbiB family)
VRRPQIGARFAADLSALDLICRVAEAVTAVRIGFTRALRSELRTMILEELDFHAEARYQELFRRQAKRDRQPASAPRVHHELSGREVLVSEYVRGVWLQDLIRAKERDDRATLDYLASLGITPARVAKRLLRIFYWSTFETLFYHADPHPGNVLVRPGGRLVLTNFGACGPTTHRNRRNYAELFRRQANRDLDGIVQVFGSILSPLPQTDVHGLLKAAEAKVARWQYGFDSTHAEWWERGSVGLWIGILELAREHRIPISIETVRFFRACLLSDTSAARLSDRVSGPREYGRYRQQATKRLRRRATRRWRDSVNLGGALVGLDQAADLAGRLVYKLQDFSDRPSTSFLSALNKGAFVASSALRLALGIATLTVACFAASTMLGAVGTAPDMGRVLGSPWYWGAVGLLVLRAYRIVQFRLREIDR